MAAKLTDAEEEAAEREAYDASRPGDAQLFAALDPAQRLSELEDREDHARQMWNRWAMLEKRISAAEHRYQEAKARHEAWLGLLG